MCLKKIATKRIKKRNLKGKIVICSPSSMFFDEKDQYEILSLKENGGKIFIVQHGACYGDLYFQNIQAEYGLDKFISWAQKSHPNFDIEFDPLPSPQLKKLKYNKTSNNYLFVSHSGVFVLPRYGLKDFSDSYLRYTNTIKFFEKINPKLRNKFEFKDMIPKHFSELDILKKKFDDLRFTSESPEKRVEHSKLVVTNNYSTFFYKCLASNIPTILLTKFNVWKLTEQAKKIYKSFEECGISFENMDLAAKKINEGEDSIDEWWNSQKVQNAREKFCKEFAWSSNSYFKSWVNYFWNI